MIHALMSDQSPSPSPEFQERMAAILHDVLLQFFLAGVYTSLLCFLIIYAGSNGYRRTRCFIILVTIVQYGLIVSGALGWGHDIAQRFMKDTSEAILETRPAEVSLFWQNICQFTGQFLADGLIIWRCWNVWNRNVWFIVVFVFISVADTCLYAYELFLTIMMARSANITDAAIRLSNAIGSAADFLRAGFTLTVSFLIILRIYTVGRMQGVQKYRLIVEVVVESALLYSVPFLVFGIYQTLIPTFDVVSGVFNAIGVMIPGLAPLLLVLRVYLGFARPDSTWKGPIFSRRLAQDIPLDEPGKTMHISEEAIRKENEKDSSQIEMTPEPRRPEEVGIQV